MVAVSVAGTSGADVVSVASDEQQSTASTAGPAAGEVSTSRKTGANANGNRNSKSRPSGGKGKSPPIDHDAVNAQIIAGLNVIAEYRAMGVVFASEQPRSSGMIECYAVGREESRPSAAVNVTTGRYIDSGGTKENLSLWDFAEKFGGGKFASWQLARMHFAERAGVDLDSAGKSGANGKRKKSTDWTESLDFAEWSDGHINLASIWCSKHKPGTSVEAIRDAGGMVAYWPCYKDKATGEKKRGRFKCIALPCYGEKLTAAPPVAWVLWNINGRPLERFRGKDVPPDQCKMLSVGPTRGAMCGAVKALEKLAAGGAGVELVWKSGGMSDMLAVMTSIPPELREKHLVVTNASSETGDVLPWQAALFAGLKVFVVHDADTAGEVGAAKWLSVLAATAGEVRKVVLPFVVKEKSGRDSRDYLNGAVEESEAAA